MYFKRFHICPDVMIGLNWKHELCRGFLTYMKLVDRSAYHKAKYTILYTTFSTMDHTSLVELFC